MIVCGCAIQTNRQTDRRRECAVMYLWHSRSLDFWILSMPLNFACLYTYIHTDNHMHTQSYRQTGKESRAAAWHGTNNVTVDTDGIWRAKPHAWGEKKETWVGIAAEKSKIFAGICARWNGVIRTALGSSISHNCHHPLSGAHLSVALNTTKTYVCLSLSLRAVVVGGLDEGWNFYSGNHLRNLRDAHVIWAILQR